jgi:hypothetical protein
MMVRGWISTFIALGRPRGRFGGVMKGIKEYSRYIQGIFKEYSKDDSLSSTYK